MNTFSALLLVYFGAFLTSYSQAQNVGIGTPNPAQKLEVAGIVRLNPEPHTGNVVNRLITIDNAGDLNANSVAGLAVSDGVTYDISGRVVRLNNNASIDLPGPINNHTVVSHFILYTTCDDNAIPLKVHFKRFATSQGSFSYGLEGSPVSSAYSNTMTFTNDWGCGAVTITVSLNPTTNTLQFSVASSSSFLGLYIHSGRTTFLRWQ